MRTAALYFCKRFILLIIILPIFSCLSDWGFGNRGNVNLARATWLVAESVPLIIDKGGVPGGGAAVTPLDDLFTVAPGKKVSMKSLGGAIDPTGTTLGADFDGDGILNINETTTNVWVADYPVVESSIAAPITMKVTVWQEGTSIREDINNEINSDDFESGKTEGSEKIHQTELNLRTVQFQDQFSQSTEASASQSASVSYGVKGGVGPVEVGMNFGASASASWEAANSVSATTTKWADRPFKNNSDSDAQNLKANSSSQNARKYRSDRSNDAHSTLTTKPDGGYVRAALYIKNNSVNMPVKLKNILCSLMFESPTGELIPVASFKLQKADGSPFEIEVYGDTEFGPYVIELLKLNGHEVERAVALGYNPKIYIVDYEMTHVQDSNYRSVLLNFSGDNLKIVEENAKGRTALIKIVGPNKREMHRVTAFETSDANNSDICKVTSASTVSPGISLENALKRISCSGTEIQFADYVMDFAEIAPTLGESKVHVRGIASLGGIKTSFPCDTVEKIGSDGVTRKACVQKPISQWTTEQVESSGLWAVYSKGKYYSPTSYYVDGQEPNLTKRIFDPTATVPAAMLKGISSLIWAGDTYDIVYISFKDLLEKENQFGSNPIETGLDYKLNTAWDLSDLGDHPYYPGTHSLLLGDAGFREKVQLDLKLENTHYLNANFGTPQSGGIFQYFTDFAYTYSKITEDRYSLEQVFDFEVSLGFGGSRTDWIHVRRDIVSSDYSGSDVDFRIRDCGKTLDHTNQTFSLCIQMPKKHPSVDESVSIIKLYIRPALNSAYRRTAWPLRYSEVRKVQGNLFTIANKDETNILVTTNSIVTDGGSMFQSGDILRILGDPNTYNITQAIVEQQCEPNTSNTALCKKITVSPALKMASRRAASVYVLAGLSSPNVRLTQETGFFTDWNSYYSANPPATGLWETRQYLPLLTGNGTVTCSGNLFHPSCIGFNIDFTVLNWIGGFNQGVAHWNSWADGGNFVNFLSGGLPSLPPTTSGKIYRLETNTNDIAVNDNVASTAPSEPLTVRTRTGQNVTIWKVNNSLYARAYNLKTGATSNQILINSANAATGKFLAKSDDEIYVVYEATTTNATDSIYVQRLAIDTNGVLSATAAGLIVNNRAFATGSNSSWDMAVSGANGIVVWNHSTLGANIQYYGKGRPFTKAGNGNAVATTTAPFDFNMVGGAPAASPLWAPASGILSPKLFVAIDINSNDAIISYAQLSGTTTPIYSIFTEVYDFSDSIFTGGPPIFSTVRTVVASASGFIQSLNPIIGYIPDTMPNTIRPRGFIAWLDTAGVIFGRGIDLDSTNRGAFIGGSNLTLDTGITGTTFKFSPWYVTPHALATYTKGSGASTRVYARAVYLTEGILQGSPLAMDSATTAGARKIGSTALTYVNSVPKFVTTWEHTDPTSSKKSIRARIGNLFDLSKPEGTSELIISKTNDYDQTAPVITEHRWVETDSSLRAKTFITWLAGNPTLPTIKGQVVDLINPPSLPYGLNNFFVSPLVERDYTLKAKISF